MPEAADLNNKAPPRKAGRPSSAAAGELLNRLLSTALEMFLDKGFEGTSLEGVARAAAVNKDTIYRRYGTKEQLYRAAVLHGMNNLRSAVRTSVMARGTPEQVLERVILQLYRTFTAPAALALTRMSVAEARRFPDMAAVSYADSWQNLDALVVYLAGLKEQGVLAFDDAREAATALATLATGGLRFLFDEPLPRNDEKRWAHSVLTTVLNGWQRQPAQTPAEM